MDYSNSVIIIESPNKKAKYHHCTGAKVIATVGHFKDMPAAGIGIDLKTYTPTFRIARGKQGLLSELKQCKGKTVYIATDPDREGYAIATHVHSVIKSIAKEIYRSEVFEITETGIMAALGKSILFEKSNTKIYDAFLGRRVGDRLIGYMLSPDVSNKLNAVYSVGRVQSPGLRLVVDREEEIINFKHEKYYIVKINLSKAQTEFQAFHEIGNIKTKQTAEELKSKLKTPGLARVLHIEKKSISQSPKGPFTTSTLQQAANNRLNLSAETTMDLAQGLFEKGLITYHRTDSQRLSMEFLVELRSQIKNEYGPNYCPEQPIFYATENSQADAHEGIRHTSIHKLENIPDIIKANGLNKDHEELYRLICSRAIASQMKRAENEKTNIKIEFEGEKFNATGTVKIFDGWSRIYNDIKIKDEDENALLPALNVSDEINVIESELLEKGTKSPPRYSEASLINALEKKGIGRPSTYATILKTLKTRRYIKLDKKNIAPTSEGFALIGCLKKEHPWVIDYKLTSLMEDYLDKVQEQKGNWREYAKLLHKQIGFNEPPAWKVGRKK
jgi:DNA topoisomerase-1